MRSHIGTELLRAYEHRGAALATSQPPNALCVMAFLNAIQFLDLSVDTAEFTAAPIVALLRQVPSALQFMIKHPVHQLQSLFYSSDAACTIICASVFGKEEEQEDDEEEASIGGVGGGGADGETGAFTFTQSMVDAALGVLHVCFSGEVAQFWPSLPSSYFKPVHDLCISDKNKEMLLQSPKLISCLLDHLFLDPNHPRRSLPQQVQESVQADAADALLQLSLVEQGRMLLQSEPVVMEALHALAVGGHAMTGSAAASATGALAAIEGVQQGDGQGGGGGGEGVEGTQSGGHVMMSCES